MDQHAEHLALYQYGQLQAQLAPPLWLQHTNRRLEPVHRSHVYSSSVIYFPMEPTQWYVRARLRLNEFDMYSITNSAIPHSSQHVRQGFAAGKSRPERKVQVKRFCFRYDSKSGTGPDSQFPRPASVKLLVKMLRSWSGSGSVSTSMRVIHLTHSKPRWPGATKRRGKPCS